MTTAFFYQVIGAVIVGNAICFGFAYGAWHVMKVEKATGSADSAPLKYILLMTLPGLFALGAALMLET